MSDELTPDQPHMPTPGKTRRLGRVPRALMVGGLTVGLALGGAGIAFAATSGSSTPSSSTPGTTTPAKPATGPGPMHRGFKGFGPGGPGGTFGFGGLGGIGGLGRVLHGSFTTPASGGGYKTVEVQVGKVTAVGQGSITVKSADGYSDTYVVTSSTVVDAQRDGISSVKTGDQVQVLATKASGKDTAANVVDTTKVGASRKSFGFGPRPAPPAAPAPPTTASTQSAI